MKFQQTNFHIVIIPLLLLLSGCSSFNPSRRDYVYQEAFYLTTRAETGKSEPAKRYNSDRGEPVFGVAMAAIDPRPVLSSFADPQPNRILQQDSVLQRAALQQLEPLAEDDFLDELCRYTADGSAPQEVLIFIHGYKRTFSDSVENAARLRHQLAFPGPVIAFSWPSTNAMSGYMADVENLEWSAPALRGLIEALAERLPNARLHILAHSLGNRALVRVLSDISTTMTGHENFPIGQVVLVAPDLDRGIFMRDVVPQLEDMPFRMTLYVSSEDFPLIASGAVFQYPRLGDSREGVPVIPGVETIDVSDAISYFNGHGYYEADRTTIDDLFHLIREGTPASGRPGLVEVSTEEGSYWRLQPGE
jgi:esterase/lipase superfamily enzyme